MRLLPAKSGHHFRAGHEGATTGAAEANLEIREDISRKTRCPLHRSQPVGDRRVPSSSNDRGDSFGVHLCNSRPTGPEMQSDVAH